jgi:hypothetical protein
MSKRVLTGLFISATLPPVGVETDIERPLTHASASCPNRGFLPGAVVSGFFVGRASRGHHPALENVGATDSDKRG